MSRVILLGATLALLLGFESAQAAGGNVYVVTTNGDDPGVENPSCSGAASPFLCTTLRDAISVARSVENPTINFAIADTTIKLGGPLPETDGYVTIDGTSQNITISGQGLYQVMTIVFGTVTINALTIANGNCSSAHCNGGAIGVYTGKGCNATLNISNSTFYGNSAISGGAIYSYCSVNVVNSTFFNNSATGGGGAIGIDGSEEPGLSSVTNSTFSTNTSPAIYAPAFGNATLTNTILAAELPVGTPNPGNCLGAPNGPSQFNDGGGNLSDDPNNTCNFATGEEATSAYAVPDNGTATPPLGLNLGTLASNGGPTETIALLANSAAISSAIVANYMPPFGCPAQDQRGVNRPMSGPLAGTCSSGALQYPVTSTTTSSMASVAQCTAPAICNPSGGDSQTVVAGTPTALGELTTPPVSTSVITENLCIIAQDPRQICGAKHGDPNYTTNTTFPVSEFCPNFGNTVVPNYLCGDYSSSGPVVLPKGPHAPSNGLAVLQGIGEPVNAIPGLVWLYDANPDAYFGFNPMGMYSSECNAIGLSISPFNGRPDGISVAWAPWSDSAVEGEIPESPLAEEVTSGCGGNPSKGPGVSITLIGVTLNPNLNLINFALYKYLNLELDVAAGNIPNSNKAALGAIILQSAGFLAGRNPNHACAEATLYDADNYVLNNADVFLGNSFDPNSYGRIRMRILNLFYTLYTRVDMQPNPITNLSIFYNVPLFAPTFTPTCNQPHL